MRYSYILPAFASLALAFPAPAPQDIDIDMVIAAPDPTYSIASGVTAQVVTYDTTAIAADATAAASSISIAVDNVLSTTAVAKRDDSAQTDSPTAAQTDSSVATQTDSSDAIQTITDFITLPTATIVAFGINGTDLQTVTLSTLGAANTVTDGSAASTVIVDKRSPVQASPTACTALPSGVAAYAPDPSNDNAAAFVSNPAFATLASAAPTPDGYAKTFTNANGASQAYGYLGYSNLASYDPVACSQMCTNTLGCMAFNIYLERDPSVDPGTGSSGCANPASVTYAKCSLWGGPVSVDNASNIGQKRNQFDVVIAASNGYQSTKLITPSGYTLQGVYPNDAINAPYDSQGYNTYMGATIFSKGPFDIQLCADYCTAQTAYNVKHPANDATPPKVCSFFNTYMLYLNNASTPQGQYCSLYTEAWNSTYAVNSGQYRGSDRYFVALSYTYSNNSVGAVDPSVGYKKGAIYQAVGDMKYFPTSLTSTFLPFCTSLLGYTNPVSTVTALTTATPLSTSTVVVTSTVQPQVQVNKRTSGAAALATPNVLAKYPVTVISSACSMIATSPTSTITTTAATSTVTASTSVVLTTQTSTVTAAAAGPTGTSCSTLQSQLGRKSYTAANGKQFNLNCNAVQVLSSALTPPTRGYNYRSCMEWCSTTRGCTIFDFSDLPILGGVCTLGSKGVGIGIPLVGQSGYISQSK